jgi:hypothetical protein
MRRPVANTGASTIDPIEDQKRVGRVVISGMTRNNTSSNPTQK